MNNHGFTFIELLFVLTLTIFMIWITLPLLNSPLETYEEHLFFSELKEQVNLLQLENYRTEIRTELTFHKNYYKISSHDFTSLTNRYNYPERLNLRRDHPTTLVYQENGLLKNPQTITFIDRETNELIHLVFPFGKSGFYVK